MTTNKEVISGFIVLVIFLLTVLWRDEKYSCLDNADQRVLTKGNYAGKSYTKGSGHGWNFTYYIDNKEFNTTYYPDQYSKDKFSWVKTHGIIILYSKEDPQTVDELLIKEDFEEHGLKFPDSLKSITNVRP